MDIMLSRYPMAFPRRISNQATQGHWAIGGFEHWILARFIYVEGGISFLLNQDTRKNGIIFSLQESPYIVDSQVGP